MRFLRRQMAPHWHRVFGGSLQEISAATSWVASIGAELDLPGAQIFAMQVCLEELMSNVIRHGGSQPSSNLDWPPKDPADPLSISITVNALDDRVSMTIEDSGRPFDVAQARAKGIDQPLDHLQPGGLGIQLIKNFANDLTYSRTKNGNQVIVTFMR